MALFPNNPQYLTPYANFRFRVKWGRIYVLGVSKVSGLARSTQAIQHRETGDPSQTHHAEGQNPYGQIRMERGVSYDAMFEQWANKVPDWTNWGNPIGENTSLLDFRKDLTIEVYNEAGMKIAAYNVHRAWVSELSVTSDLDGTGNAMIIESITLQNEGWERDDTIVDAAEPSFVMPAKSPFA